MNEPRTERRRARDGRRPEAASLEVSCVACERLHAPERPVDVTNPLCGSCADDGAHWS
jgi:hypothetical protein